MDLKGLKVTVAGISRSGMAAALLLKTLGAKVYATDNSLNADIERNISILKFEDIDFEVSGHTESFVKGKDLLVASPGVSDNSPVIKWASEYKLPIISELELGYLFCKGKVLAITGTNGKTTTTTLIGRIIEESGRPVVVCGNIGTPFCSMIPKITSNHLVVLEVSSFQLERINRFKPYVSVILNITNDHLDRHRDFNDYVISKSRIFMNQEKEDFLILNHDDPGLMNLGGHILPRRLYFSRHKEVQGAFVQAREVVLNIEKEPRGLCSTDIIQLKGLHNLDNVMASILVCKIAGVDEDDIIKGISNFEPLRHRFQSFAEIDGVEFINDSKATNVDSTVQALLSLDKTTVLIAGGRDKASDFSLVRDLIKEKVRTLILIGEAAQGIEQGMDGVVPARKASTLEEAVELAYGSAKKGDVVILSPMCASFDMFKDYAERGELFMKATLDLKAKVCVR